jgi:hypothetical protein
MSSIFSVFSIAGVVMFGHRMEEFVTFERSQRTCLFVLMGDFEWEELRVIGDDMAFFWLSLFFFVIVLLSLNMLLAIIFETYTTVRERIGAHSLTLWDQSYETLRRLVLTCRGKRVTLMYIERCIRERYGVDDQPDEYAAAELEKEGELTMDELLEIVPGLKLGQAGRLMMRGHQHGRFSSTGAAEPPNGHAPDVHAPPPQNGEANPKIRSESGDSDRVVDIDKVNVADVLQGLHDLQAGQDKAALAMTAAVERLERIERAVAVLQVGAQSVPSRNPLLGSSSGSEEKIDGHTIMQGGSVPLKSTGCAEFCAQTQE